MKVYVVLCSSVYGDDCEVIGVYDSCDKAKEFILTMINPIKTIIDEYGEYYIGSSIMYSIEKWEVR